MAEDKNGKSLLYMPNIHASIRAPTWLRGDWSGLFLLQNLLVMSNEQKQYLLPRKYLKLGALPIRVTYLCDILQV